MPTAEFQTSTSTEPTSSRRVFPLHLTPFEYYMFADDRPEYPMTFIVEFEFTGRLDRAALTAAIDDALEKHPLLRAIIQPAKLNRDCWVDSGSIRPHVHFGELDQPIKFPGQGGEYIDLRHETGLRIWVRSSDDKVVLTTQFHHAVCDGIGSYQFLGDVLLSYSKRTGADLPESPHLANPRNRGRASYDVNQFLTKQGRPRGEKRQAAKIWFGRSAVIRGSEPQQNRAAETYPFPGILSFEFDKNEHRELRQVAQSRGQMLNDLLLEKLFETLNDWTTQYSSRLNWGKNICVMMPLDLREPGQELVPACNVVTYAFIRRGRKLIAQPQQLKASLGKETLLLKHQRHQTSFMNLIVGSMRYQRLLKYVLSRNHCLATTILSNTGDPTKRFMVDLPKENGMVRCGNLLLTSVSGVPPMRIKTRATISIFTYRRVLKICLRCDPHFLTLDDTQQLLDQYVDRIQKTSAVN